MRYNKSESPEKTMTSSSNLARGSFLASEPNLEPKPWLSCLLAQSAAHPVAINQGEMSI